MIYHVCIYRKINEASIRWNILNAPCDTVKGVLENFHANIPHFSAAFPRCENIYRKVKRKKEKGKKKTGPRGRDVTLQIWRGIIKVWIQNPVSQHSKNYPRTPTNFSNLLCSSTHEPCKNPLTRLLARLRSGKRNFRGKDPRMSYPGINES